MDQGHLIRKKRFSMTKIAWMLALALAFGTPAFAQVRFQAGPEIGYAIRYLPQQHSYRTDEGESVKEIYLPKFNPVLGFNGAMRLGNHGIVQASLQYQLTGSVIKIQFEATDSLGTYRSVYSYSHRFHKLCLPLTLGYDFPLGKFRPFIALGYRAGVVVYGQEVRRLQYQDFEDRSNDTDEKHEFRPRIDRWAGQLLLSVGTQWKDQFCLSLNAAVGKVRYLGDPYFLESNIGVYRDVYATLAWRLWRKPTATSLKPMGSASAM
jgi:hypothetical protein